MSSISPITSSTCSRVVASNYIKGFGFKRVKMRPGNGIIASDSGFWRLQRRMMQPAFQRRVIAQISEMMRRVTRNLMARWEAKAASGEQINVPSDTSELARKTVLRTIFSENLDRMTARRRQSIRDFERRLGTRSATGGSAQGLDKAGLRRQRTAARTQSSTARHPLDVDRGALGNRSAHERQSCYRRGDDFDRSGSRNHRQYPELGLVAPVRERNGRVATTRRG